MLLALCSICHAQEPAQVPSQPASHWHKQDISNYLDQEEVKPVLAGDEEINLLIVEQTQRSPRGVAIMVPDINYHPASATAFGPLRYLFSDIGFTSLSIVPLDYQSMTMPPDQAMASALTGSEVWDSGIAEQLKSTLALKLKAALSEAENYPGHFIIVAQGQSAALVNQSIVSGLVPAPDGLVMISPYLPEYKANKAIAKEIATNQIPTLDLLFNDDNRWVKGNAERRFKQTRKHLKPDYRQRSLGYGRDSFYLMGEIDGWARFNGW